MNTARVSTLSYRSVALNLAQSGVGVPTTDLTATNVDDARVLLKTTKAKLVVISARLQSLHDKPTRRALEEIDPAVSLLILDEDFAMQDPGEAAAKVLRDVGRWLAEPN
jgi:hypothetical protein